jgi:hypothetical protein
MLRFSIVFVIGMGCASGLHADPMSAPCVANSLAFYESSFNVNRQCSVGMLNFQGFSFEATGNPSDGLFLLGASQILVTPNPAGTLGGGFSFSALDPASAPFAVGMNQSATYFIDFFFELNAGQVASSASLGLDPPFGDVSITQSYCAGLLDGRDSCSTGFQTLSVGSPPCIDPINNPNSCTAALSFSPQTQNEANVLTTIILTGSSTEGASFDSISGATNILGTSAPEPVSGMLLLGGLAGVWIVRRRRFASLKLSPGDLRQQPAPR